jgi:hypothetical protein
VRHCFASSPRSAKCCSRAATGSKSSSGFETRLARLGFGALTVWLADRYDLICFKLYAAADHWPTRDRHLGDLIALGPTVDELRSAATWMRTHDSSSAFRDQLEAVLGALGVDLADVTDL